jgi:hypothetical protein
MNSMQVNPDLDELKFLEKILVNLSRCGRQELFLNNSG